MYKEVLGIAATATLAVGLVGCAGGPENYEDFTVKGVVSTLDEDSVTISDVEFLQSEDTIQSDLLVVNPITLYDSYNALGCYVESTTDTFDSLLEAGKIAVGNTVVINGNVGKTYEPCYVEGYYKGALLRDRLMIEEIIVE